MSAIPRYLIAALAVVAVVTGLADGGRQTYAAGATVTVDNFSFTDATSGTSVTTIQAGETVTWPWADTAGVPHTSTSTNVPAGASTWDSGVHAPPFTFGPVTFSVPGTYTYQCAVHPTQMVGTIIVQADSSPTPAPSNTPRPATRTSTPSPAPTDTPMATPPPSSPAPATAPPVEPALIAAPTAIPSAGVKSSAGGSLPRAGTGTTSAGHHSGLLLALGLAGAAFAAGGLLGRRRGDQ